VAVITTDLELRRMLGRIESGGVQTTGKFAGRRQSVSALVLVVLHDLRMTPPNQWEKQYKESADEYAPDDDVLIDAHYYAYRAHPHTLFVARREVADATGFFMRTTYIFSAQKERGETPFVRVEKRNSSLCTKSDTFIATPLGARRISPIAGEMVVELFDQIHYFLTTHGKTSVCETPPL